jgi:hypothetical protein
MSAPQAHGLAFWQVPQLVARNPIARALARSFSRVLQVFMSVVLDCVGFNLFSNRRSGWCASCPLIKSFSGGRDPLNE